MKIGHGVCVILALARAQSKGLACGAEVMPSLMAWNKFYPSGPHYGDADRRALERVWSVGQVQM